MGIINLADIQVNMVLAKDIKDRSGRVLLAGGSKINEKHLRVFRMWGVTEADIQGIEKDELTANIAARLDPLLLEEMENKTRERFLDANMENPFNKELFRLVTIRSVKQGCAHGHIND